jgi:peroxiredoxin
MEDARRFIMADALFYKACYISKKYCSQERIMALAETPAGDLGLPAPDFSLPGVDGKRWTLAGIRGEMGLLVMFICNHCPYVKAALERIIRDARELKDYGINSIAIMSNDPSDYPEDSFDNMRRVAAEFKFPFPYVFDESQTVAKSYGAVCTPDFFGYNAGLKLQYRGRLDAGGKEVIPGARRELFEAMKAVANSGQGPRGQFPSMGCSIKWKQGNT